MDHFKLEDQLKKVQQKEEKPMSPLVRSRLDETYDFILETGNEGSKTAPCSWMCRPASLTAAAGLLGVSIFASGFVSPAMADSIKQIPLVGSIFSSIEADLGLQSAGDLELTSNVNSHVSYQDIQFKVTETVYDGTRAAFVVNVSAPSLKEGMLDTGEGQVELSNSIDSLVAEINGQRSDEADAPVQGVSYWSAGEANPNMLVFEMTSEAENPLPETFNAAVYVRLTGVDHEFKLDVPLQKSVKNVISLQKPNSESNGEMIFSVSELSLTPVTIRIRFTLGMDKNEKLTKEESNQLLYSKVAVFDDKGNLLPGLSGEAEADGKTITWDYRFGTTQSKPEYLILKPFVQEDGDFPRSIRDHQYIEGLEMKVNLSAQK
ncbi:DUF4179 domain-containing protein [Domibacillus robiginosus]|uniref:DUF4179 domain-containing protein n=1 Tax=Domibacillus robiginosus TaxID=1071054 RepID=UPI00067C4C28|nr:DUF4179 domain-containing protein [Domibacillus robiginosus]